MTTDDPQTQTPPDLGTVPASDLAGLVRELADEMATSAASMNRRVDAMRDLAAGHEMARWSCPAFDQLLALLLDDKREGAICVGYCAVALDELAGMMADVNAGPSQWEVAMSKVAAAAAATNEALAGEVTP